MNGETWMDMNDMCMDLTFTHRFPELSIEKGIRMVIFWVNTYLRIKMPLLTFIFFINLGRYLRSWSFKKQNNQVDICFIQQAIYRLCENKFGLHVLANTGLPLRGWRTKYYVNLTKFGWGCHFSLIVTKPVNGHSGFVHTFQSKIMKLRYASNLKWFLESGPTGQK